MKKHVIKRMLIIVIFIFCIFSVLTPNVYAGKLFDIITSADNFVEIGETNEDGIKDDSIKEMSNILYNVILAVGIVIAVIVGIVLGIKFMTGSIEEKAKVKETLVPYVAGCVVLFGAFTIWKVVVLVLQST